MTKIEINGKQYPCRVTMGAMLRFKRETGKDVSEIGQNDISGLVTFLWCCIVSACAVAGEPFLMTLLEFADQLEAEALTDFYASMRQEEAEKKTENAGGTPASPQTS